MCGIGEMVLSVKCRHVSGTTSAPFTTTTTEASAKEECDISSVFHGYPITATGMHLSLQAHGVQYTNTVSEIIHIVKLKVYAINLLNYFKLRDKQALSHLSTNSQCKCLVCL